MTLWMSCRGNQNHRGCGNKVGWPASARCNNQSQRQRCFLVTSLPVCLCRHAKCSFVCSYFINGVFFSKLCVVKALPCLLCVIDQMHTTRWVEVELLLRNSNQRTTQSKMNLLSPERSSSSLFWN